MIYTKIVENVTSVIIKYIIAIRCLNMLPYHGPLLDHVYGVPGIFSSSEYSAVIISGDTYAPTPIKAGGISYLICF